MLPSSGQLTISRQEFTRYITRCDLSECTIQPDKSSANSSKPSSSSSLDSIVKNSLIASIASAVLSGLKILEPIISKIMDARLATALSMWGGALIIITSCYSLGKAERAFKEARYNSKITTNYLTNYTARRLEIDGLPQGCSSENVQRFLTLQKQVDDAEINMQHKKQYAFGGYILSGVLLLLGGMLTCSIITSAGTMLIVADSACVAYALWENESLYSQDKDFHMDFTTKYLSHNPAPRITYSTDPESIEYPSPSRMEVRPEEARRVYPSSVSEGHFPPRHVIRATERTVEYIPMNTQY